MKPDKVQHKVFEDSRGVFIPIPLGDREWNQVNVVLNPNKFTLRGIHYQTNPPQTKYIKVVKGEILDILYDLNTGEVFCITLGTEDALLIGSNFAHGYLTLEKDTIVTYLTEGAYSPNSERSIVWNTIPEIKNTILKIVEENTLTISDKDMYGK